MLSFTAIAQEAYFDHPAFPYVIIAAAILVLVAMIVFLRRLKSQRLRIAEQMLEQWAASYGLVLLERQSRWFARGIFFGNSNAEQSFWRIAVRFPDGWVH